MLTYTAKKGALKCVEATLVMCPLCRKELYNIPRDIDRCMSRFSSLSGFSFDGSTAAVAEPSFSFGASTTAAPAPAVASSTTPSTTITSACDFTADVAKLSFLFGASTTAAPAPAVASATTVGNMADDDPFTFVETIDDNDDDDDVDGAETAAMEATREKAEARKTRILEMANQRMNYVVNGEQVDNGDADQKKSVSSAARIRAARQRRHGKKKPDASTTTEETTTTTTTTTNEAAAAVDSPRTEQPDSKIPEPTVSATECW